MNAKQAVKVSDKQNVKQTSEQSALEFIKKLERFINWSAEQGRYSAMSYLEGNEDVSLVREYFKKQGYRVTVDVCIPFCYRSVTVYWGKKRWFEFITFGKIYAFIMLPLIFLTIVSIF